MQSKNRTIVEDVFHRVAGAEPARRAGLMDDLCGSDMSLRREIEALLAADESSDRLIDRDAADIGFSGNGAAARPLEHGQRIGGYEIVRLIAGGGMGNVYEAVQLQPRRTVALKLLRAAFASTRERRRFLYESELLGQLRHPNIAHVFESGIHESDLVSLPYFAMEYIADATTVTEFARARRLSTRERLGLFEKVCEAVQHGHQKGVVHRDLKPGNILVDSSGEPKIIDYGVARAVDGELRPQTLCTSVGEFIGTLQYMSPEQLKGDPSGIDTRSDVYALGLILHELIADRRPYELAGCSLPEAAKTIEAEPTLSLRNVEHDLRSDLETMIRKSMEREPARRYQSAGELAEEVRRLLRGDPIVARPPNAWYLLRKFAGRHRALVAAAIIAIVGLATGTTAAAHWAIQAQDERDAAVASADRSERVLGYLEQVLSFADPKMSNYELTVRDAVDQAAEGIDAQFGDDPLVAARLHHVIGCIYVRQERTDLGREHLTAALAIAREMDTPDGCWTANTLCDLAWIRGDDDRAEPERLFREALEIRCRYFGDRHPLVASTAISLCSALHWQGKFAESEPILRQALDDLQFAGKGQGQSTAIAMRYLATALHVRGADEEAEELYRRSMTIQRNLEQPNDLELSFLLGTYGRFLADLGRQDEANALFEEEGRIVEARLGPCETGQ